MEETITCSVTVWHLVPTLRLGRLKQGVDDDIDFEDIKWGTFTKQLEAYNRQHGKNLDFSKFADMILKDTKKYQ